MGPIAKPAPSARRLQVGDPRRVPGWDPALPSETGTVGPGQQTTKIPTCAGTPEPEGETWEVTEAAGEAALALGLRELLLVEFMADGVTEDELVFGTTSRFIFQRRKIKWCR